MNISEPNQKQNSLNFIFKVHTLDIYLVLLIFLSSISLKAQFVIDTISQPGLSPTASIVYENGNKVFVADTSDKIFMYDGATHELLDTIHTGIKGINKMVMLENYGKLYATAFNISNTSIAVIDANSGDTIRVLHTGWGKWWIQLEKDEELGRVYALCRLAFYQIDVATDIMTIIPGGLVGTIYSSLDINPVTHEIFYKWAMGGHLIVMDAFSYDYFEVTEIGYGCGIGVNWEENKVYLVYTGGGGCYVYDRNTGVVSLTSATNDATYIVYNHIGDRMYSSSEVDNRITIIEGVTDSSFNIPMTESYAPRVCYATNHVFYSSKWPGSHIKVIDDQSLSITTLNASGLLLAVNQLTKQIFVSRDDTITIIQDQIWPLTPPLLSSPINGTDGESLTDTLRWAATPGATSYHIEVSCSPQFGLNDINEMGITDTILPIQLNQNNTIYYWRLCATNESGTSEWSETWFFITANSMEDDFLCADVNEEGLVNILDIITMVNYIMGGNPDPFNMDAADVNADGGINVLDIIAMVNIIMQVPGIPCPCIPSVSYGEQTYNTVQIGDQCWVKENLNVGTMVTSSTGGHLQTNNGVIEKYCQDNDTDNCDIYGGLYEWDEAMQYATTEGAQGICPGGWQMAKDGDWIILTDFLGGLDVAGGKMKEAGLDHWMSPNTGADNSSGFTAIPGGNRFATDGSFHGIGYSGDWWSATETGTGTIYTRSLNHDYTGITRVNSSVKELGLSVRCIKGCWPQPTQANAGPDQLNVSGHSTTLAGNTPAYGTGVWHIISGAGGLVADTTSPTSSFQGIAGNTYFLIWKISTACGRTLSAVMISFAGSYTCGDTIYDDRNGQFHASVLIGNQCWMEKNMNLGTMIVSNLPGQMQTDNGVIEKYCYVNNAANCDTYGGLYEWYEAMQYDTDEEAQGICPSDWHIPSDGELTILTSYLGGEGVAGGKMKEEGYAHWNPPNTGATNESGFTCLPGGYRWMPTGSFYYLGNRGKLWTSSQQDTAHAWYRDLFHTDATVDRDYQYLEYGYSIRCLKNCNPQHPQADAGPDQLNIAGTSTTLAGNTPTYGTGLWTILSGTGGILVNPTSPTSEFQGLAGNYYTLRWAITIDCGISTDQVVISFFSECLTNSFNYTINDLTDPDSYNSNSWTDIGWANVIIPSEENVVVGCVNVYASQLCTDKWCDEVTMFLKSPNGTTIQIWEGFASNGCIDNFVFQTDEFNGEQSQGQWLIYFVDSGSDGGGTCIGAALHIGY